MSATKTVKENTEARISLRLQEPISTRFDRVVQASRRSKTSLIEEALEKMLPEFEKQLRIKQAA